MGCPILLGYAEKANEVSKTWLGTMMDDEPPPDMIGEALSARALFRDGLEARAKVALRIIVFDMLKRAINNSKMHQDIEWLEEVPADLEYGATSLALQKIKERALAWRMHTDLLQDGKAKTEGEHIMIHVKRVWHVATIAESLAHDMAGESFVTAGTALAVVMAEVKVEAPEWVSIFGVLKETK